MEAEREILTGERYIDRCHASEILSRKQDFIAPMAYKHHGRNLSFIARIARKLPRTKFYRGTHSYPRDELEFTASASNKIYAI
ncbi:hypothetical protein [uncultured Campylobacter sp.]|uniref:hypothetical protein n=1 Tax=uncultured Campylobacter sp. TaxID=218934 RepID=UPI0026191F68|nr:hypothetical protein [uncultured Campylobacter sp.]